MQVIVFILSFIGGYMIISDLYPQASRQAKAAILSYTKRPKATLQSVSYPIALRLQNYVRIGKYKRIKLENTLNAAHLEITPELYVAQALSSAILFAAITVPTSLLIFPIFSFIFLGIAVFVYSSEVGKANKAVKKKREAIESELPHFASTISEELKYNRDIIRLLSNYSRVCGDAFRREIDITLADMRTGNRAEAIIRLNNRVGSLGLSKICRGILSAMDGYNQQVYFEIVAHDLENEQDQQTERLIQTLYNKIKPYSFSLLGCMVLLLLTAIGIYMYNSLNF